MPPHPFCALHAALLCMCFLCTWGMALVCMALVFFFFLILKKKKKLFFLVVHVLSIVESVICVEEYGRNVFIYYVHEKRDTK